MKTRWMIKVESKIKEAPRGAPFILFTRSLVPATYCLKWSMKWTYGRSVNWFTLRLIFWVHIDILSSFNDSRSFTRYLTTANKYQPMNDRFTRTTASLTEVVESWILLQPIYTNDSEHPNESWMPSPIDIYERFVYIRTIRNTRMSPGCLLLSI